MRDQNAYRHRGGRKRLYASAVLLAGLVTWSLFSFGSSPDFGISSLQGEAAIKRLKEQGHYESLREAVAAARYNLHEDNEQHGVWRGGNEAHGLREKFTRDGAQLEVMGVGAEPHRMGLKLREVGYGKRKAAMGPGIIKGQKNRIEIKRSMDGGELAEWYVNTASGLEHGFTLSAPPGESDGEQRLRLVMAVEGFLRPRDTGAGQAIEFENARGESVLRYEKLVVEDARGRKLEAAMGAEAGDLWIEVDDRGAIYPVTVDPTIVQQAYLKASNTATVGKLFGTAVAISGDTVVVGAPHEDSSATGVNGNQNDNGAFDSGAVYVFARSGGSWSQQAYLKASNTDAGDRFGTSVAISGDTVLVGAPNEDSSATGVNGNQNDNSAADSGAAYVFVRSSGTWSQQAYLKASNTEGRGSTNNFGDRFGASVAISNDIVVVGAPREGSVATGVNGNQNSNDAPESGSAYVFARIVGIWGQQAYLKASNTQPGDFFGQSVAVSNDTIVIGAADEDSNAVGVNGNQIDNSSVNSGAAYIFVRAVGSWSQQAYLKASNTEVDDGFGSSVGISADTVVIGSPREDGNATGVNGNQSDNSAFESGAAYVFTRTGGNWSQQAYLKPSNAESNDRFGASLAISGDTVVVGSPFEDSSATGVNGNQTDNSAQNSGAAYAFVRNAGMWSQQAYLKASITEAGDASGRTSVAVSGETVVIGVPGEDSGTTGVNGSPSDTPSFGSGAAYVFARGGGMWGQEAYLKASSTGGGGNSFDLGLELGDSFGAPVAMSGDTVVVGAAGEASNTTGVSGDESDNSIEASGAAYIFVRTGGMWSQQAYLKASNTDVQRGNFGVGDQFGISVAIWGDTVVVGADREDSNATGVNGNQGDSSAVGSGAAYVFVRSGETWSQQAYLKASNAEENDTFGCSVAVSGDTVVVGAFLEGSNASGVNGNQNDNSAPGAGAAYVFVRSQGLWSQQAYLKASNSEASDGFGISVAISGDNIVVGASGEDSHATGVDGDQNDNSAPDAGAAYVFVRNGGIWSQQAYLKASNAEVDDFFGFSVAISGQTIVVGAPNEDSNTAGVNGDQDNNSSRDSGAAYIFARSGGLWSQQAYLKASNPDGMISDSELGDTFGTSVSVSGDLVVVGAPFEDSNATGINGNQSDNSASGSGAAYLFKRNGDGWSQQTYLKASNTEASDAFGFSVAIFGQTLVVGAPGEDSNATGVDGNQGNNSVPNAGAAYIHTIAPCTYDVAPATSYFSSAGGTRMVGVTAGTGCAWVAVSNASWAQVTGGSDGSGNGAVPLHLDANTGAARQGTITIGGKTFTVKQGANFADVATDSVFYEQIGKLSAAGITVGCGADPMGNPIYCPGQVVTREQMAAFLMRALGEFNPPAPTSQRFTDVPPGNVFYGFIDRLAVQGITLGCNPQQTHFCPGDVVTREQMSAFIMRALGEFSPPTPSQQYFNDVPPANVFYAFIDRLRLLGITLGCNVSPPLYCPSGLVTREQMAAFLVRAFGL